MTHQLAAFTTVHLLRAHDTVRRRLADQRGQGTVEYVGIILLVAGVLAAVVAWGKSYSDKEIGQSVTEKLNKAINQAAGSGK